MVAARQGNKRKNGPGGGGGGGNKQGGVRKFKGGPAGGVGGARGGGNMKPRMNTRAGMGAMFNPSQMMDNPGYMDFNEPPRTNQKQFKNGGPGNKMNRGGGGGGGGQRRMNNNNNNNQQQQQHRNNSGNGNGPNDNRWGGPVGGGGGHMQGNNNNSNMRSGPPMGGPPFRGGPPRMHPMQPPMGGMRPPMPPPMLPHMNPRFGPPRPLLPPPMNRNMPPMGPGGPMRRMPPPRLGGPGPPMRGGGAMRGMPRGMGHAGPMRRSGKGGPPVGGPKNADGPSNLPPNSKNLKNRRKPVKGGAAKKLHQPVNPYDLNKPWVNDEIKDAYKVKEDLENQLKGKKNDQIFAQFKVQRDKFVALYDAAKTAHVTKAKEEKVTI